MIVISRVRNKFSILRVGLLIFLLPFSLLAQTTGDELIVGVDHSPAGDERDAKIVDILDRAAIMELEASGLRGRPIQDKTEEFSPDLSLNGRYLEQQEMLKLEYRLQETSTGKQIAAIQLDTAVSHFLDRAVADAVQELLHRGREDINRILLAKQEQKQQKSEMEDVAEGEAEADLLPKPGDARRPRRGEAEATFSGAYMLGRAAEYLPYGLLLEGRFSYPVMQGEKIAWRLGGTLGVARFFSAVDYKAGYVKTLLPLGLLTEVRVSKAGLNKQSSWAFRCWWTAGAALRLSHEDEEVNKVLAPAFPYAKMGIGALLPLGFDRLSLAAGFSGVGLFHLYEAPGGGEIRLETILGINIDLGIVWRM